MQALGRSTRLVCLHAALANARSGSAEVIDDGLSSGGPRSDALEQLDRALPESRNLNAGGKPSTKVPARKLVETGTQMGIDKHAT